MSERKRNYSNKTSSDKNGNSINVEKLLGNENYLFREMVKRQLPDVPPQWKLRISDMKRICKYVSGNIFDKNKCCLWNGYITNLNHTNKGTYVNFYFKNKKVALHRLLYSNFVSPLNSDEYLKFKCKNRGICCNINHYEKYKYLKNFKISKKERKKKGTEIIIVGPNNPDELVIDFD
ncbi:MAG: hypothetical protein QXW79_00605 [Thermoplasmata archaeon]